MSRSTATIRRPSADSPSAQSQRPIRVAHCIGTLSLGGAQRVMIELIRHLDPAEIETDIIVLGSRQTAVDWPSLPVEPIFLGYNGSRKNVAGYRSAFGSLVKHLQSRQIDVVHAHLWGAAGLSARAAARCGIPHLVHIHDTSAWIASTSLRDRLYRWSTRRALSAAGSISIAVSQDAWRFASGPLALAQRDHRLIPNGVNTTEFQPREAAGCEDLEHADASAAGTGRTRVGLVARLNPGKGHDLLIRAIAHLIARDVDVELHLAGDGGLRAELEQLAASLGLDDVVRFHGNITGVPEFLHQLDIFVLPSLAEGMPLSVLEAMAVGLPVIASDVGGTGEVVKHEVNGLLVAPNDVGALASAIERLAVDPELRRGLAEAGARLVRKEHSWATIAGRLQELYRDVTERIA